MRPALRGRSVVTVLTYCQSTSQTGIIGNMNSRFGEVLEAEIVPSGPGARSPALRVQPGSLALREEIRHRWLRSKKNRSGSNNTVEAYNRDIETYFAWCDSRGFDVFTIFPSDVEEWVDELLTTDNVGRFKSKPKPRSKATVARMVTAVSSFYSYAAKHTHGRVTNPVDLIERPRVEDETTTRALSLEEVQRLLTVAQRRGNREYALVQLLIGSGIRVSELCLADTGDLGTDSGHDVITVRRKGGKRANVRIPPATARALRRYIRGRRGPLFLLDNGNRMTRRMVDHHLTSMAKEAGIIGPKERLSPHSLRHTAATLALDAGASLRDVQVQLGHARPDTTARYDRARRNINNAAADALAKLVEDGRAE